MKPEQAVQIHLADYQPYPFAIETTDLCFQLHETATLVQLKCKVSRKNNNTDPLVLDGENMQLLDVIIDGKTLNPNDYILSDQQLVLADVPDEFLLEIETKISPADNHALNGLYLSAGMYCTQCEAQGFRNITYYPDRPDVMSSFTVRVEADKSVKTLLSNGNLLDSGDLEGNRHFTLWEDPFKKPAYLFALVGGVFDLIEDHFITMSGRTIALQIYVDPGDAHLAEYAMDALKRSMKWDEEAFGREYDLDLFMIVAVRSFNFGAMENKGLNIFNSSVLLADAKTATDADFERIESVVAHEYFHNWTGNRITCRDWFQLCLKEGLTVFRDQEFSASQRGAAICRIKDVKTLRARQFPEDSGPLAHPVRPASYMAIDNFYTATVYEKGAELIRALKIILGAENFANGMDLYFATCDGTAATMEQFLDCFAEVSGQDLSQFLIWYGQAGRPTVTISQNWDPQAGTLELNFSQKTDPTPGQSKKQAVPIPVSIGLLGRSGALTFDIESLGCSQQQEAVLILDKPQQSWTFSGLSERPIVSVFRQFSAPITLQIERSSADQALIISSDPDQFNRWEEGQSFARAQLLQMSEQVLQNTDSRADEQYLTAISAILNDDNLDPAFVALCLQLPSDDEVFQMMENAVPEAIESAKLAMVRQLAVSNGGRLLTLQQQKRPAGAFKPDAESAGLRSLSNQALLTLSTLASDEVRELVWQVWKTCDNMTDTMAALTALKRSGANKYQQALGEFYEKWNKNPLVLDKWFSVQAVNADSLGEIKALLEHRDFDLLNPNRVRAVYGAFAMANLALFHLADGRGYQLLADGILQIDKQNPALAARLMGAFSSWQKVEPVRGAIAREIINEVKSTNGLSKNTYEIASKHLGAD